MNNPVGIPSGWEEIAAFFMNGIGPFSENIYRLREFLVIADCEQRIAEWNYDWRVED